MTAPIKTIIPSILALSLIISCGEGADFPEIPIKYKANGRYISVWDGARFKDLFIKGINLGVGIPGKHPGELAVTREQYARWFKRMGQAGFNTIRIYTLHYPRFYEELRTYNLSHPSRPLYLIQGIWLKDNATGEDIYSQTKTFDEEIRSVIDCVHGSGDVPVSFGHAYGTYSADVERWTMAYILGREIDHNEILETDKMYASNTSFAGRAVRLPSGSPTEAWIAARFDHVITYERATYHSERPVGFISWPTLDPIRHPTENHKTSDEDNAQFDVSRLVLSDAPAGILACFHAYPYYPNFISEDPAYRKYKDAYGPNSYVGYITDLLKSHPNIPVIIGEIGVPSSWGNAHYSHSMMHHGGHDESHQGLHNGRLIKNIFETKCAGAVIFSWMDEWFKRTWITDMLDMPRERFRLWHNVTGPEQNFGFITFDLGQPDFSKVIAAKAGGRIREVKATHDASFFRLKIDLALGLQAGESMTIGFDTYRNDLGESVLPDKVKTKIRSELALVISAPNLAQLYVTEAYNLTGIWHKIAPAKQLFHSTATNGAPWVPVRWQNDEEHQSDDKKFYFPASYHDIGKLRVRTSSDKASNLDAVVLGPTAVEVRVPWTLLQFTDPSTLSVMHDNRSTPATETALSEGVAAGISLKGELLETPRYKWKGWDEAPATVEREKDSLRLFSVSMQALPDYPSN